MAAVRPRARYAEATAEEHADAEREKLIAEGEETAAKIRRKRNERVSRITNLMHAFFWIGASVFVLYHTRLPSVLLNDSRVPRAPLYMAGALLSCAGALFLYLTVWVSCVKKEVIEDFNQSHPKTIMACVALSFAAYLCLLVAMWPIWGFVSLVIIAVLVMGAVFLVGLLPGC